jgi:hypothetical protein
MISDQRSAIITIIIIIPSLTHCFALFARAGVALGPPAFSIIIITLLCLVGCGCAGYYY